MAEEKEKLVTADAGGASSVTVILEVNPKVQKGVSSKLIDWLEKLVVKFMYDSSQPQHYLSGNFAPAPNETPPTKDLPVKGHLPECLNGEFVRVGPNPSLPLWLHITGIFDGDGMIHSMHIKVGKATYVPHYVRTSRLKQEELFEAAKFMKVGDLKGLFGLLMVNIKKLRKKV